MKSDHFDGKKFFNPSGAHVAGLKSMVRWARGSRKPWPKHVVRPKIHLPPPPKDDSTLHVTFINHVTFLIRTQNWSLITDPHFSLRASPFSILGPKRVCKPGIELSEIPQIDYQLISHNHYDHMDLKSLKWIQKKYQPKIFAPLKNGDYMAKKGIHGTHEMDWWQSHEVDGLKITLVPAQHWSARSLNDRNHMLWGGFVIEFAKHKIFFAGDTGYADHFKEINMRLGDMTISLLPIGAYEPRWFMHKHHMNPEDAVIAHQDLNSQFSIGMHFGTFRLTNEGIDDPIHDLSAALIKHSVDKKKFVAPQFGETFTFNI